ncbi:MAG: hypothetical protein Q9227_002768 [Pyrenula ochraceoflavens]
MSYEALLSHVHDLSDLELAVVLCLIAKEHCLIKADDALLNDLGQELSLIANEVFGLSCAVVSCSEETSIDDFGNAILDQKSSSSEKAGEDHGTASFNHTSRLGSVNIRAGSTSVHPSADLDNRKVVNIVIARNFNLVNDVIQVQALEAVAERRQLIRRKRIFSRTTVHLDHLFISHTHDPTSGFDHLESSTPYLTPTVASSDSLSTNSSSSSVIRTPLPAQKTQQHSRPSHSFKIPATVL